MTKFIVYIPVSYTHLDVYKRQITYRPIMIRGEGDITRDAEALMGMMMRSISTKTREIQGANNEGAEVLKATAEITIIDPKYISGQPITKLTMGDGLK